MLHLKKYILILFEQSIDGINSAFVITLDRKERMDFTYMAWSEGFGLVVPSPEEESRLFAFIGPFQPTVSKNFFESSNTPAEAKEDYFIIVSISIDSNRFGF